MIVAVIIPLFLASCSNENTIIINSFGATNLPKTINAENNFVGAISTPVRDDGAVFEGWYYSINFDEKYKIDPSKTPVPNNTLDAKYDKCYCFSLRYGTLGCFGVEDEYYKLDYPDQNDTYIDYFIPAGRYNVTFTDGSSAKIGSVMIYKNDGYSRKDGYPFVRQQWFRNYGEQQEIIVNEDEHVFVTSNTVFIFQRSDVDSKYTDYQLSINNSSKTYWIIFIIVFVILFIVFFFIFYKLLKKQGNRIDFFIYKPNEDYETRFKKTVEKLNLMYLGNEPIITALVFDQGFLNAMILTSESLVILNEQPFNKTNISKKTISSFVHFENKSINLFAVFDDASEYKLGFVAENVGEQNKIIREFEDIVKTFSPESKRNVIPFRIENGIVYFYEKEEFIKYNEKIIKFEEINDVTINVDSGQTTHTASLSGALVGGVLFGGLGALIGANVGDTTDKIITSATITITTDSLSNPIYDFVITSKKIVYGSDEYKELEKMLRTLYNMFIIIKKRNEKRQEQ